MKILKRILLCFICSVVLLLPALAGCNIDLNKNSNTPNNEYKLLTTLNKYKISNYYASGSTIQTTNSGAVTITLNNDEIQAGFIWDLSSQNLNTLTEYAVKFNNLNISGLSATTKYTLSLKLNWQDSSYKYLRYYDTQTKLFGFSFGDDNRYLYLDNLDNDHYEVKFKFNHDGIKNSDNKKLYFDFTGIEENGNISFNSISLYEIKETTSTPSTTPAPTPEKQWGTTQIITVISLVVFALLLLISLIAAICKIVALKKQFKNIKCENEEIHNKPNFQAERTKEE